MAGKASPAMKMADIAEQLGISTVAVSLALRGSPQVSKELRSRVARIAAEHGFRTRRYPQRRGSSAAGTLQGRIAVVKGSYFSDSYPVAALIRSSVLQRLNERKVPFEVVPFERLEAEPALLDDCRGILSDYSCKPEQCRLFAGHPHASVMNEELGIGPWDLYKANDLQAGELAAEYLIGRGFAQTLLVYGEPMSFRPETNPRLQGFRNRMKTERIPVTELRCDYAESSGSVTGRFKALLDRFGNRLGIFAFNDLLAYRICLTLDFLGLVRRPGELEIISCDNTFLLKGFNPPVPEVDLHIQEIASRAVDGLLWRIENPSACAADLLVRPGLVVAGEE